ncbi:MAG: hypothetical protein A2038_09075 [Deltaproteobacteria bacterium GWA2_57_13]|nr:MAG: hypothetical protein A2038_09075 [Deltaproteobacteria bacterium GWA2_57_13]
MKEKLIWFVSGGIFFFLLFVLFGGLYTITPPNGMVDVAYKMNRVTGRVWLIKTYGKQVGPVRVLAAREAVVERTKDFGESDIAQLSTQGVTSGARRR